MSMLWHDSERIDTLRKEPPCPNPCPTWKQIETSCFNRCRPWMTSVQVPLTWWSGAAASPPVIAPKRSMRAMTRSFVSLAKRTTRQSPRASPRPLLSAKPNEKSPSFIGSRPSVRTSLQSTRRSAVSVRPSQNRVLGRLRKKTAAEVHREVAREIDSLLQRIFAERRRTGGLDLEAVEMAIRATMHQAGAAGLTQLLTEEAPAQRHIPCACGGTADYEELRSKQVLTAVGPARMFRPYYLCSRCHEGQFPTDQALDVERTEFSPGVRRMLAVVGSECSSFRLGAEQMLLLAGLEVTAKAVERVAEAIGADIAAREQTEIQKAIQLELPVAAGRSISTLYVELDGTGVPVVPKETEGREGRQEGKPPHTREAKMGCVFTQTTVDAEGYAVRDEASTTYLGRIQTACEFGRALYTEDFLRGWSRAHH